MRVSIIVPVYQVEQYLEQCLDSLVDQSVQAHEIILVNDGSTDGSGAICDRYAGRFENVRVIHKVNGGLSSARNSGIRASVGDYVCFVDSDDWVDSRYIERLLEGVADGSSDMAVCEFFNELPNRTTRRKYRTRLNVISGKDAIRELYGPDYLLMVLSWNKIYRRELFENVQFCENRIHEDEEIAARLFLNVERVALVKYPLYHYRLRGGSITQSGGPIRMDGAQALISRYELLSEAGFDRAIVSATLDRLVRILLRQLALAIAGGSGFSDSTSEHEHYHAIRHYVRQPEGVRSATSNWARLITYSPTLFGRIYLWKLGWRSKLRRALEGIRP